MTAVTLSGLPGVAEFNCIGEPETLKSRWDRWSQDFDLYVRASGVTDGTQKRALLLHLAGTGIRDVYHTKTDEERGGDADFKKLSECLENHFKLKKNVPLARQKFNTLDPKPGETVDSFITRLKTLAKDCEFGDATAAGEHVRDRLMLFISNRTLKSKLYQETALTLEKTIEIIRSFHDKDVLILKPEHAVNYLSKPTTTWHPNADGEVVRKMVIFVAGDVANPATRPVSAGHPSPVGAGVMIMRALVLVVVKAPHLTMCLHEAGAVVCLHEVGPGVGVVEIGVVMVVTMLDS